MADNLGASVAMQYDTVGLPAYFHLGGVGAGPVEVFMAYDAAGRLVQIDRLARGALRTTLEYDLADRLTSITHAIPEVSTLSTFAYTYNLEGELTDYAGPDVPAKSLDSEPTVASLAKQLKDADAARRAEAVRALAKLGEEARPAYADLMEGLKDTDAAVRDEVGSVLSTLKPTPADLPAIRAALRDLSDQSRTFAAGALAHMGADAKEDLGYLRLLAAADSEEVRDAAEMSIQTLEPILVAAFIRDLSDSAPDVRRAAALELGQIKSDPGKALPNLIEALSDKNSAVRVAATDALVMLGPAALPVLVESLNENNIQVRRTAIACLGRMGPDARTLITDALAKIGPEALPTLTKLGQNDAQPRGLGLGRSPETPSVCSCRGST